MLKLMDINEERYASRRHMKISTDDKKTQKDDTILREINKGDNIN